MPEGQTPEQKIQTLGSEVEHWKRTKQVSTDERNKTVYDTFKKIAELAADT